MGSHPVRSIASSVCEKLSAHIFPELPVPESKTSVNRVLNEGLGAEYAKVAECYSEGAQHQEILR